MQKSLCRTSRWRRDRSRSEAAEELLLTVTDTRFRQTILRVRIPGQRSRRAGDCEHHAGGAQWPGRGRDVPGPARRRRDAGDGCGATDPGAGGQVRITGRQSMGVTLFRLNEEEHMTSVFPIMDEVADVEGPERPRAVNDGEARRRG